MGRKLAPPGIRQGGKRTPPKPLLSVHELSVVFPTDAGPVRALDRASYAMDRGRTLGVVGESGCGKTIAALATLRLLPPPGRVTNGKITFENKNLFDLSEAEIEAIRGDRVAMIFQEPATALNPAYTVGDQIAEVLETHRGATKRAAMSEAVDLLDQVGISSPGQRVLDYPHSLSGGMRQRVMIAMALACRPALLIADEPTTALDVTVQSQILELLLRVQGEIGMAIQFISHNLAVVSEIADNVVVMYAGRIVEQATSESLFRAPQHPYTQGLLKTVPSIDHRSRRLPTIPGVVPEFGSISHGCHFRDRCPWARPGCARASPKLENLGDDHHVACFVAAESEPP